MKHVTGAFEVKLAPQAAEESGGGAGVARMLIDKTFHGELDATSKGQMLAAGSAAGSGGYVAMEIVTGALGGKKGTFALQHSGTMNRGVPTLVLTVVPDSGTGELVGLVGKMDIVMEGGKHSYVFDYSLPE